MKSPLPSQLFLVTLLAWGMPAGAELPLVGMVPQHAVCADFNNDGRTDMAVATAFDDSVSIMLQASNGTYPVSQQLKVGINQAPALDVDAPRYLQVVDLNSDGNLDLVVLCSGNHDFSVLPSIQWLVNLGNGRFGRSPANPTVTSLARNEFPVQFVMGDFVGDSSLDAAIANLSSCTVQLLGGDGAGKFTSAETFSFPGLAPQDIVVIDVDGEGHDELLVVGESELRLIEPRHNPGGYNYRDGGGGPPEEPVTIQPPMPTSGLRAAVAGDLDQDGRADIVLADAEGRLQIIKGLQSNGTCLAQQVITNSGLAGCSDVDLVDWDSDLLPDMVVTNRTANTVAVVKSSGGVSFYPTGSAPRRVFIEDLDGDGRRDIIVANEGDQGNATNADLTFVRSPRELTDKPPLQPVGTAELTGRPELRLPHPVAISTPEQNSLWVLESDRRHIQETRMDASERESFTFPFEVGGFVMTDDEHGYAIERFEPRIHRFEVGEGMGSTITLSIVPGELGFGGLAYNEATDTFYVSVPSRRLIYRVSQTGSTLGDSAASPAAWSLQWDGIHNRLLASTPGRASLKAYNSLGAASGGSIADFSFIPLLGDTGFSGVGIDADRNEAYLLSTTGMLLRTNGDFVVSQTATLAPLTNVRSAAWCPSESRIYVLGEDGFVTRTGINTTSTASFSLWQSLSFINPVSISYDPDADELLILDSRSPIAARYSRSGAFRGIRNISETPGSVPRVASIAVDPSTGALYTRSGFLGTRISSVLGTNVIAPAPANRHLAASNGTLLTALRNSSEVTLTSLDGRTVFQSLCLPPAANSGPLLFVGDSEIYRFVVPSGDGLNMQRFERVNSMGVDGWQRYE